MTHRLVYLQGQLLPPEDEIGHPRRALRRREQLDRLLPHPLGVAGQVGVAHHLVAAGAPDASDATVTPALGLRLTHRGGLYGRPTLNEML